MNLERAFTSGTFSDDEEGIDESRNPEDIGAKTVLKAAENGDLEVLRESLSADPTLVNSVDREGYTPLHRACYNNHPDIVKFLLENGANIGAKTELLWEPLHSCCRWNHTPCAEILIAEGADVNAQSEGGQTPLHIAASHGASYEMVQLLLLNRYINPNLTNSSQETAFDIAKRSSKYRNIFDMADPLLDLSHFEEH